MNREQFLQSPCEYLRSHHTEPVPTEWVREAWRGNPRFKSEICSEIDRSISKGGDFLHAGNYMQLLATALTCDEVLALFLEIRSWRTRAEIEWRSAYEGYFAACAGLLPPRETWAASAEYRENLVTGVVDALSYSALSRASGAGWMAQELTFMEVVELYAQVKGRMTRPEWKWRPLFEAVFPACRPLLPPYDPTADSSTDVPPPEPQPGDPDWPF